MVWWGLIARRFWYLPVMQGGVTEGEIARDLANKILQGNEGAEAELIERYSRGLAFFLRRQCSDPALAEDIHQETFRLVLLRLREGTVEDPSRIAGFLQRTACNLLIGEFRKTGRRKTDSDEDAVQRMASPPPQLDRILLQEEVGFVRRLISELKSRRDRQILYQFYVADEEKEQICGDLELEGRHFDRVLFRARERFKDLMQRSEKRRRLNHVS